MIPANGKLPRTLTGSCRRYRFQLGLVFQQHQYALRRHASKGPNLHVLDMVSCAYISLHTYISADVGKNVVEFPRKKALWGCLLKAIHWLVLDEINTTILIDMRVVVHKLLYGEIQAEKSRALRAVQPMVLFSLEKNPRQTWPCFL